MRKEMKKVLSLVLVGTILTGCAGSAGSKTAGGTDGDKAPAAVEKTEANEEGTEKPYDGVTITMMMNQGTYATTFSGVFWKFVRKSKKNRHYHGYSAGNRFYGCDSGKTCDK